MADFETTAEEDKTFVDFIVESSGAGKAEYVDENDITEEMVAKVAAEEYSKGLPDGCGWGIIEDLSR